MSRLAAPLGVLEVCEEHLDGVVASPSACSRVRASLAVLQNRERLADLPARVAATDSASARIACADSESGANSSTGVPASADSRSTGSRGIRARSGTPTSSASACPPPAPKSSSPVPTR